MEEVVKPGLDSGLGFVDSNNLYVYNYSYGLAQTVRALPATYGSPYLLISTVATVAGCCMISN